MEGITFIEIDGERYFFQKEYELKVHALGNTNEQIIHKERENKCEDILNVTAKVGDIE